MSMDLDTFFLMILLAIPTAVALSTCMGMGGSVVQMGTLAWPLRKRAKYSASAAEAMIFRRILHKTWTEPLGRGVYSVKVIISVLRSLRNYNPLARLRALETYK